MDKTVKDATQMEQCRLDGRMLEAESHALLVSILRSITELEGEDGASNAAVDLLLRKWLLMIFEDSPDKVDAVMDKMGQYVDEDITEYHTYEVNHLN